MTHVMINDPTVGYGIFIENMLSNMPVKPAGERKRDAVRAPTVKQFYIKAEKGRDFLAPFSHDLACKV